LKRPSQPTKIQIDDLSPPPSPSTNSSLSYPSHVQIWWPSLRCRHGHPQGAAPHPNPRRCHTARSASGAPPREAVVIAVVRRRRAHLQSKTTCRSTNGKACLRAPPSLCNKRSLWLRSSAVVAAIVEVWPPAVLAAVEQASSPPPTPMHCPVRSPRGLWVTYTWI
jgi:hypothetical protein